MTTSSPNESAQNPLFKKIEQSRRPPTKMSDSHITLAHGSGGKAMRDLIEDIFAATLTTPSYLN
jgi:Hydrogenase maturation factor